MPQTIAYDHTETPIFSIHVENGSINVYSNELGLWIETNDDQGDPRAVLCSPGHLDSLRHAILNNEDKIERASMRAEANQ